MGENAVVQG